MVEIGSLMYIGRRGGIRFYNAMLGIERGIFMFVPLGDNSVAKAGV